MLVVLVISEYGELPSVIGESEGDCAWRGLRRSVGVRSVDKVQQTQKSD